MLDADTPALVALELPSGKQLGSLALSGSPLALAQSPDGSRLVSLDRGPGEDKHERGYKATGRSSATIIDAASLQIVGRVELGNGLMQWAFSRDGSRLFVVCPGYEAKKPSEALTSELVSVDLATAREAGRIELELGSLPILDTTGQMVLSRDGQLLPLLQGLPRSKRFPYPQSRLFIVDLAGPSIRARLDTGGFVSIYSDGTHFYLLDPGKPDKNSQKNRNGSVQVASLERAALAATLDGGRGPRELYPDEVGGQVFVASDGAPAEDHGELRVVRSDALAATLKVAAKPKLVVREGDVVYVVGDKAVTLVDPVGLEVLANIPLARGNEGLVDDDDSPTELKVSLDRKRAFIHYGLQHKVVTLDLEAKQAVGTTKTGRGGRKFLGNLMGGLYGWSGMWAVGYSMWIYTRPSMLAVRPDGRYAYAVNNQTKDITVVDGATGKSVEMIGGNGYSLEVLKDGRFMYEVSDSELRLVDLERQVKTLELSLSDLRGLFFAPDRSVAVALAKQTVLVLDGSTGEELGRLGSLASPNAIVFEGASRERTAQPE